MKDETILSCVAIGAIAVLDTVALAMGYDGAILASSFALIGGIAGYKVRGMIRR